MRCVGLAGSGFGLGLGGGFFSSLGPGPGGVSVAPALYLAQHPSLSCHLAGTLEALSVHALCHVQDPPPSSVLHPPTAPAYNMHAWIIYQDTLSTALNLI